ncbi:hypothetical protein ENSA5_29100 [Enhygromyxa salina]|uniref:FG-GAP repeat protein n=1 Tax=Enhygromyxa salina TaxID=215803 RepID=A0A2S9Y1T7_9BACT|nr:hypothetical protein [Enhygromyxa salina]PRP99064.1 hypothetical protein ENSA5_29100 [Enhygromyxa salina]
MAGLRETSVVVMLLALGPGCLPGAFEALADAAPVQTVVVAVPGEANAELSVALTVPAAATQGQPGRVLFGAGDGAIGWFGVDPSGVVEQRFASFSELTSLASHEQPTLTGLALSPGLEPAEGLVRVAATETSPDRIVRFGVADFTRVSAAELDVEVYPWVADPPVALNGALAVVQLDEGLPELLSASAGGLFIWDALGAEVQSYVDAREQALVADPAAFDDDPVEGWGLTRCVDLDARALAGGRVLAGQERAALALDGDAVVFVAVADPPRVSAVGAPIYDCARASLSLPGSAATLTVVDLGDDDDDDLLVGAPGAGAVWVYENLGDGLPDSPSMVLEAGADELEFGASLAVVELGGDAPEVIVVGAPGTPVGGKVSVGRVSVFDASDGALLRVIEDLEPRTDSRHGLAVHGLELGGREELVVTGARELRVHWSILAGDEGRE